MGMSKKEVMKLLGDPNLTIADWAFEGDLSITAIEFEGTMEQWGKVSKSEFGGWYSPNGKETVVRAVNCSGGDVAIWEI